MGLILHWSLSLDINHATLWRIRRRLLSQNQRCLLVGFGISEVNSIIGSQITYDLAFWSAKVHRCYWKQLSKKKDVIWFPLDFQNFQFRRRLSKLPLPSGSCWISKLPVQFQQVTNLQEDMWRSGDQYYQGGRQSYRYYRGGCQSYQYPDEVDEATINTEEVAKATITICFLLDFQTSSSVSIDLMQIPNEIN